MQETFENPFNVDPAYESLAALPTLRAAPPRAEGDAGIAVIPLFASPYWDENNMHAYIRAALHSRASCLRNTDAVDVGVPIKLYVEDVLLDRFIDIFFENHIDFQHDVLVFSAPPLKNSKDGIWGKFSKKACFYFDSRFAEYPWLVGWDADVFFPQGTDFSFKHVLAQPPDIGYIWVRRNIIWSAWEARWMQKLERTTALSEIPIENYMLPLDALGSFKPEDELQYPVGYLWSYPAKHFHTLNTDFVYWMSNIAPYIGSDELIASVWSHRFDLNIVSLKDHFGWRPIECNQIADTLASTPTVCHGRPNSKSTLSKLLKVIGHGNPSNNS